MEEAKPYHTWYAYERPDRRGSELRRPAVRPLVAVSGERLLQRSDCLLSLSFTVAEERRRSTEWLRGGLLWSRPRKPGARPQGKADCSQPWTYHVSQAKEDAPPAELQPASARALCGALTAYLFAPPVERRSFPNVGRVVRCCILDRVLSSVRREALQDPRSVSTRRRSQASCERQAPGSPGGQAHPFYTWVPSRAPRNRAIHGAAGGVLCGNCTLLSTTPELAPMLQGLETASGCWEHLDEGRTVCYMWHIDIHSSLVA